MTGFQDQVQEVLIVPSSCQVANETSASPRKDAPNPQQGMADPASIGANTAPTVSNTACTSPLTVTSLEAAANAAAADGVPDVVPTPTAGVGGGPPVEKVEALLSSPMANLGLDDPTTMPTTAGGSSPPAQPPQANPPALDNNAAMMGGERNKGYYYNNHNRYNRPLPTVHDNRKVFVGGLPTDVEEREFLDFFQRFGEVIDSVVMVDRLTKRSRGFGFVTFADENVAMSLLTAIPGKTGYVMIGGKQCEVKASTPKVDDGLGRNGVRHPGGGGGGPGMWRPNQNYHSNQNHHHNRSNGGAVMMSQHHPPPQKHYYRDNDSFNSGSNSNNVDTGRNYDELYAQPPQASYHQPMPVYGRSSNYQQNYNQNVYNSNVAAGYGGYTNAAAGQASSWEASYPAAASGQGYSVGHAQYTPTATPESGGYYDPYAVQQYPHQYANDQYGNAFVAAPMSAPPVMMGDEQVQVGGYADNDSYYGGGASVPSHGDLNNSGAFEPYPQQYVGGGDYGEVAADGYE